MKRNFKLNFIVREPGRFIKPSFNGPFQVWKVNFAIDGYRGTADDFVVISSGKRQAVHRFLWYKLVWDELTFLEYHLFLTMPETLKSPKMVGFLRARLEVEKSTLRHRLNLMESLLGDKITSRTSYLGMKRTRIDILTERRKLRRTPKFSGWIRNNSRNKGSLNRGVELTTPEISDELILENLFSNEFDWYQVLTVGELSLLHRGLNLPDEF